MVKKGSKLSEETKKKISISMKRVMEDITIRRKLSELARGRVGFWKGKSFTEEHKNNIGLAQKGKKHPHSEETKKKIGLSNLGKRQSEKQKRKMVETRMRNGSYRVSNEQRKKASEHSPRYWLGKKFSEEHKQRMRESSMKISKEIKEKRLKLILRGLMKRPSSFEQKISDLCFKYNLPFIYKGNGDFLINFKNPDFVNEKDKIVIEVFYSWYKIRNYGSVENYKKFCIDKYEPLGWKVIFLDEQDLNNKNWEQICLNKINKINNMQIICKEVKWEF